MNEILHQWFHIISFLLFVLRIESFLVVNITFVKNAQAKGAVCLDGSPPAYHLDWGFGEGVHNWLVHIQGGAWCENVESCVNRSKTQFGSSKFMDKQFNFTGILANKPELNPDFYNWNRVVIRYCDGASFTGDVEEVDPDTKIYYRGARIFDATMEELLEKGMKYAQNAIISGCSAGGLTSILHCDTFRHLFPTTTRVKCLADAGFFLNSPDITGKQQFQNFFNEVVTTHGSAKNLPQSCTSKMNASLCFFAENVAREIKTPLFILNSEIDSWQIQNILVPGNIDPSKSWLDCKIHLSNCSDSQLQIIKGFGEEFVKVFTRLDADRERGYFISSCHIHCQAELQESWFAINSPKLGNKRIAEAVGDWFYSRSSFQEIDCPYPCDNTCTTLD